MTIQNQEYYQLYNSTTKKWYLNTRHTTETQWWSRKFRSKESAAKAIVRMANHKSSNLSLRKSVNNINSVVEEQWEIVRFVATAVAKTEALKVVPKASIKRSVAKAIKENRINPTSIAKLKTEGLL